MIPSSPWFRYMCKKVCIQLAKLLISLQDFPLVVTRSYKKLDMNAEKKCLAFNVGSRCCPILSLEYKYVLRNIDGAGCWARNLCEILELLGDFCRLLAFSHAAFVFLALPRTSCVCVCVLEREERERANGSGYQSGSINHPGGMWKVKTRSSVCRQYITMARRRAV
jgi:hypothetical protein